MKDRYKKVINTPNELTETINYKLKITQPSLRQIGKWREEWVASGNDHRMSFQSYKRGKCKRWHIDKLQKKEAKT